MIRTCCNRVIDEIFSKLTSLYEKESKGKSSHTILIMTTKRNEITFANVDVKSRIVIEKISDITYIIHIYNKQNSIIDCYVPEDRVEKWDMLYKKFKDLIESDSSMEVIKEVEYITTKFFA